jgi:colicin import membrane protein
MPAHAETGNAVAAVAAVEPDAGEPLADSGVPLRRPNLSGDLDSVLEFVPNFRIGLRGYDRWQVDSYVAWAEREIRAARRTCDELATRFGANAAELERVRRQLTWSEGDRGVVQDAGRIVRMLELAADEAAARTAAGAVEADHIVEEARSYATAMLRRAGEVEDAAAVANEEAARSRTEAAAALEQAGSDAAQLRTAAAAEVAGLATAAAADRDRLDREAAEERDRLDREAAQRRDRLDAEAAQERDRLNRTAAETRHRLAAEATRVRDRLDAEAAALRERQAQEAAAEQTELTERARAERKREADAAAEWIAAARRELDDLRRERERAREFLRRLTEQITGVLSALSASVPGDLPNIVAPLDPIDTDDPAERGTAVPAARSTPVPAPRS